MLPTQSMNSQLMTAPSLPRVSGARRNASLNRRRLRRAMEGVSLWLAFLLLLFVHPLYAEANQDTVSQGVGELRFVDGQGRAQGSATLLNTNYRVTVSGLIADVQLTQTFQNPSQSWREAVFVFPLSEGASVYGLTMTAGERRIEGEIREKAKAKQEYAEAKREGKKVARVDQQRPNLFTTHLANIPPGESIKVELNYQQTVRYQSGLFELRLPTTLTPRYMPGEPLVTSSAGMPSTWQGGWSVPTSQVPDADQISPFTVRPSDVGAISHRASVALEIKAGLPINRVSSPSHQLTNTWNGHTVHVVPGEGDVLMDRDVIVQWAPARGMAPSAAVFQEQWQGESYLMAMMVPGLASDQTMPRELVFVIDTSGSMAGESIRQARHSLLRGLDTLGPDDTFNVIQFNSQTASLFMGPVPASGNNLARAHRYVRNLNADGGTEMAPALEAALQSRLSSPDDGVHRLRQVVFITDGSVGNEAALFSQIQQQLGDARLFTVGIGSAPNMHFMKEAARYGRGTYTAITSTADVQRPLDELFGKMQSPVLTDIQVDWPQQIGNQSAQPDRIGDLFKGEPLMQVVRGHAATGSLSVAGRLPDGSTWQQSLSLDNAADGRGLHRMWARERIDGLLAERTLKQSSSAESEASIEKRVTQLGLAHQLITPYTSFLAVDKTPSRAAEALLDSDSVPTLLPAGSTAGMLRYPQTATLAPLFQAIGLLGLMFSVAIALIKRRALV